MTRTRRVLCLGADAGPDSGDSDDDVLTRVADALAGESIDVETALLTTDEAGPFLRETVSDVGCVVVVGPCSPERLTHLVDEVVARGVTPVVYYAGDGAVGAETAFDCGVTDYVGADGGLAVLERRVEGLLASADATVADGGAAVDSRFRSIVEWATDPIFLKDDAGRYRYINEAGARLFDASVEEIVGQTDGELFDDADAAAISERDRRVLEDGETITYEASREFGDERRVLETTKRPYAPDGETEGIIGISRDVTERHEQDRELRRYGVIVESVDDGVYELDAEGRFKYVNEALCDLTGYTAEELEGRHVSTVKGDAGRSERALEALLSGETNQRTFESTLVRKYGPAIDCEDHMAALDGEASGVVGVVRDVTEQQAQREMLSELVESSRNLMGARDREEVADMVAQAVRNVLGFELNAVRLYDGEKLVPAGTTTDVEGVEMPTFELGEGGPGEAFASGSSVVIQDTSELDDDYERDVVRSEMHFAMGVHGTISIGATDADAFTEIDEYAGRLLATSAAAASNRAKREEQVREARERVDALVDRINGLIENTVEVLVQSATREELEGGVCEQLTTEDAYEFAWLGQPDVAEERIELTTWDGDSAAADAVAGHTVAHDGEDPASIALDEERPRVYGTLEEFPEESVHAALREAGQASMMVIPLIYKDASYGVLSVYAPETDTFQDREQIVLSALGRAIANAINAIESGRILSTNQVIELEFTARDDDLLFARLASAVDGKIELTGSVYQSDGALRLYFSTFDVDADAMLAALEADETVTHASCIAEHDDEAMFEAVVAESLIETLADHGAVTKRASGTDGIARYAIELPYEAEAREVFGLVEDRYDQIDLVGYHEHERPVQTRQEFREAVTDRFTNRQETAIRSAYLGGFFEWPRDIDGDELAEAMDISRPTYHQHLRAAQQKVFDELFDPNQRR